MALNVSRKRKHSGSAVSDVASPFTDEDSQHAAGPEVHEASQHHVRDKQDFTNFKVQDHARLQIGNNHYNYHNVSSSSTEAADEVARRHFMEALAFKKMDLRRAAIDSAYGTTCQWILEEERFVRWRASTCQDTFPKFYWLKGKPGSGKSTIMKSILEHLEDHMDQCSIASFFFNARGGELERSSQDCYRSLLHQILELIPRLHTVLRIPKLHTDGQDWEIAVVRDKLREAILHLRRESLVFMIDALDECDLQEARDMIYFLDGLATTAKLRSVHLKICFASRHYPNIAVRSCESIVVENQEAHTNDIRQYISENLHVGIKEQKAELWFAMMQRSQGVFMWVILVTRRVNDHFAQGTAFNQLLAEVYALPSNLDTLIQGIIADGASDACLLPMLFWTLVGDMDTRVAPPSLSELCFGVLFSAGKLRSLHRKGCLVDLDDTNAMNRFVLHSSKGLVEVIGHDPTDWSYNFIHESVRQHILAGGLIILHPSLGCDVKVTSHAILANWCLEHVRHDLAECSDLLTIPRSGRASWNHPNYDEQLRLVRALPLLSYTRSSTFDHIEAAARGVTLDLHCLHAFPLTQWINLANVFAREGWYLKPPASLTYLCLENSIWNKTSVMATRLLDHRLVQLHGTEGGIDVLEPMDQQLSEVLYGRSLDDFCGGRCGTPLVAAAYAGHTDLVKLLLASGASPNICSHGLAPCPELDEQATKGPSEIDLDTMASNSCQWAYGTPLAAAASHSDDMLPLVELLLAHDAKVNGYCGVRGSALGSAIYYGCWDIFDLLQDNGADINLKDHQGYNIALRQAIEAPEERYYISSQGSRETAVEMLLHRGAHAEPTTLNVFLHMAARAGRPRTVELLINAGADPTCRDVQGRTALHAAIEGPIIAMGKVDHVATARLLLDLGVDINACSADCGTALVSAVLRQRIDLVMCLLDQEADERQRNSMNRTALDAMHSACEASTFIFDRMEYHKMVQMLSGADPAEQPIPPESNASDETLVFDWTRFGMGLEKAQRRRRLQE